MLGSKKIVSYSKTKTSMENDILPVDDSFCHSNLDFFSVLADIFWESEGFLSIVKADEPARQLFDIIFTRRCPAEDGERLTVVLILRFIRRIKTVFPAAGFVEQEAVVLERGEVFLVEIVSLNAAPFVFKFLFCHGCARFKTIPLCRP